MNKVSADSLNLTSPEALLPLPPTAAWRGTKSPDRQQCGGQLGGGRGGDYWASEFKWLNSDALHCLAPTNYTQEQQP